MDFKFDDEQAAFRSMAADFARDHLAPNAARWDQESYFPVSVLKQAAVLGMAGMIAAEDIGGSNLTRLAASLIFEQLASGCIATSAFLSIHNMVTTIVDRYGDAGIRMTWGKKLAAMDILGSYCLTEPNSGSDAASLQTQARIDGDHYVINGSKAFISGGSVSDIYICMVRTGDASHKGISCILIEKDTPGLSFGVLEKKMGWRAQPTCMLYFENCRVPITNRIGKEGEGFKIALNALNGGRVNIASCSLGGALACLRQTQNYLHERKQFGKSLGEMQALRFYYADMLSQYEAARLMVYRAASALDNNDENAPMYCAMAKQQATDSAFQICDKALQIHGGYGYLHDYGLERIFRDLRVHQILEGTNEIMREIIAKSALDKDYFID